MSQQYEPNPTARRSEDFPKTTTIPDGWVTDCLMDKYNQTGMAYDRGTTSAQDSLPVPTTGRTRGRVNGRTNGKAVRVEPQADPGDETESLFMRRLEPFPAAWDANGMGL